MTTNLSTDFMRTLVLVSGFRGNALKSCQCALILMGLRGEEFSGALIPAELTNGSRSLAGCAVGSLITMGLAEAVRYEKSPHKDAKGRRVAILRIPADRYPTARAWLRNNGFMDIPDQQLSLAV